MFITSLLSDRTFLSPQIVLKTWVKRSNFQQIPSYNHIVLLTLNYPSNLVHSTQTDTDSLRL